MRLTQYSQFQVPEISDSLQESLPMIQSTFDGVDERLFLQTLYEMQSLLRTASIILELKQKQEDTEEELSQRIEEIKIQMKVLEESLSTMKEELENKILLGSLMEFLSFIRIVSSLIKTS
jgi:hypothetical protein